LSPSVTRSQLPTIGLVHGIDSDSGRWIETGTKAALMSALYPTYVDTIFTPHMGWSDVFPDQLSTLLTNYGARLGPNTILIGHSDGGIVSRYAGQHRALLGVTTMGSPQ